MGNHKAVMETSAGQFPFLLVIYTKKALLKTTDSMSPIQGTSFHYYISLRLLTFPLFSFVTHTVVSTDSITLRHI